MRPRPYQRQAQLSGQPADELSEAGAVSVADAGQVQQDVAVAVAEQFTDELAQPGRDFTK